MANEEKNIAWYAKRAEQWHKDSLKEDMSWPYRDFISAMKPGGKVLDLACGTGRDLLYFKNRGFDVEGLDGCAEFVDRARSYADVGVMYQSFSDLNLEFEKYDGVFANACLMHVEASNRQNFLEQIHKCLKVSGIFYAQFPFVDTEICDGRKLIIYNHWAVDLMKLGMELELNEGRPAFLPEEDQKWRVIRLRKM